MEVHFDTEKDLILLQLDCITDVDDLHTLAAFVTLMSNPDLSKVQYYPIAGTYGIQEGLYVPPNELFKQAFGNKWSDADADFNKAIEGVKVIVKATLSKDSDIWMAEAGQSDFTAALLKAVQADLPKINTAQRFHVVQHSDWNEKSTFPEALEFVKNNSDYRKIQDGNTVGSGTPGFHTSEQIDLKNIISSPKLLDTWELAMSLSNKYNGKGGRYKNTAVANGGLDFSDLVEVCSILGLEDIKDTNAFFETYSQ